LQCEYGEAWHAHCHLEEEADVLQLYVGLRWLFPLENVQITHVLSLLSSEGWVLFWYRGRVQAFQDNVIFFELRPLNDRLNLWFGFVNAQSDQSKFLKKPLKLVRLALKDGNVAHRVGRRIRLYLGEVDSFSVEMHLIIVLPDRVESHILFTVNWKELWLIEQGIVSPVLLLRRFDIKEEWVGDSVTFDGSPLIVSLLLPEGHQGNRVFEIINVELFKFNLLSWLIDLVLHELEVLIGFVDQLFTQEVLAATLGANWIVGFTFAPPLVGLSRFNFIKLEFLGVNFLFAIEAMETITDDFLVLFPAWAVLKFRFIRLVVLDKLGCLGGHRNLLFDQRLHSLLFSEICSLRSLLLKFFLSKMK
jgi:hypothetical protein